MNAFFRFDTRSFEAGIRAAQGKVRGATKKALFKAGVELLARANNEAPKPPIEWGDLRGSGAVQVAGGAPVFAGGMGLSSPPSSTGRKKRTKPSEATTPPTDGLLPNTVRVSFNTAYAKRLHESPDWKPNAESEAREPGQIGHHWLSAKIQDGSWLRDLAGQFLREEMG